MKTHSNLVFSDYVARGVLVLTLLSVSVIGISCKDSFVEATRSKQYFSVSGVISNNGNAFPLVKVAVGSRSTVSDSVGFYRIDSILEGSSKILFIKDTLSILDTTIQMDKNLVLSIDLGIALIHMLNTFEFEGTILAEEMPLAGCEVSVNGQNTTTNTEGIFKFQTVNPGPNRLKVTYQQTSLIDSSIDIYHKISKDFVVGSKALALLGNYSLFGKVLCNGFPLRDVIISCDDVVTQTDTLGNYSLKGVKFGLKKLKYDKEPFPIMDTTLAITQNKQIDVNFTDNLIGPQTYLPVYLGKTFRYGFTRGFFDRPSGQNYTGSGYFVWEILEVKGKRGFPIYTVLETQFDTSSGGFNKNLFYIAKISNDSIQIGPSLIREFVGFAFPYNIPIGTVSSPVNIGFFYGSGNETKKAIFELGKGLVSASHYRSGITTGFSYGVSYEGSNNKPDGNEDLHFGKTKKKKGISL